MQIREASLDDLDILYAFGKEMVAESVYHDVTPSREAIEGLLTYGRTVFYIADLDHRAIGFIGITIRPFFFSDVRRADDLGFFITPAHRGGSTALRLLRKAEAWIKAMGVKYVFMSQSVGHKMEATRAFYERCGYEVCGFNTMRRL